MLYIDQGFHFFNLVYNNRSLTGKMAHQEKTLTANPQDQSAIPGTLRWKEITDSSRLSYDPHSYAVHSCPLHPHKLNESVNVKAVLN